MIKWVNIKDAFPEDGQRVLTYYPNQIFGKLNLSMSVHTFYSNYGGMGAFFIGGENYPAGIDEYITHWAALPDGPEEYQ